MAMNFVGTFLYLIKFPWKQYLRMLWLERVWKRKEKLLSGTLETFLFSLIVLLYKKAVEANYFLL